MGAACPRQDEVICLPCNQHHQGRPHAHSHELCAAVPGGTAQVRHQPELRRAASPQRDAERTSVPVFSSSLPVTPSSLPLSPCSFPPSLPSSLPPSLPQHHFSPSLPPSLPPSLSHSLPHSFFPSSLPPSLPPSLLPSLLIPPELFELHGNSNVELCSKCGRDYLRDYRVRSAAKVHNHHTGEGAWQGHTCGGRGRVTQVGGMAGSHR